MRGRSGMANHRSTTRPSEPLLRVLRLVFQSRDIYADEAAVKARMNVRAIYDQAKRGELLTLGAKRARGDGQRAARPLRLTSLALQFVQGREGTRCVAESSSSS